MSKAAIQMTVNPSLSESKTKPSKLTSKSPTTESSAVVASAMKPPIGCSKVYYFLLRVVHFCIENSFLLVALVAFVPLPLDVTKALDFANDKFTVLQEPVAMGDTDDQGQPVLRSHEILFGFVPQKLETRYHKVATETASDEVSEEDRYQNKKSICSPSTYGYQKGYTYMNQNNQNIVYNEDGTLDVLDKSGTMKMEHFTSLTTFKEKYNVICDDIDAETVCLDSGCSWGGTTGKAYCWSKNQGPGNYYKTLTVVTAPHGFGIMNCDECNGKGYSCVVPELAHRVLYNERKNKNGAFESYTTPQSPSVQIQDSNTVLLNYTGSEFLNGDTNSGLNCNSRGVELSYNCADKKEVLPLFSTCKRTNPETGEVTETTCVDVPYFLTYMNIGVGVIGFLILLDGFVNNLRNPFGSFRYYQQALQFKRRKLLQGYLVFFAVSVVGYAIAMVFIVILPSMGHNGGIKNERLFGNAVSFKVLLMFAACLTGLLKGFDFDEDYYLISERRATNKEGCCGRGCGCCFIGGSTHAKEFVDDVLLFDSVIDLISPSDHNIFLIESAVGGYWKTGRNETLLMLLRGKDNVQNVELLGRKGGAIERRMIAECDAAEKSMNVGKSGDKKMDTTMEKPAVGDVVVDDIVV